MIKVAICFYGITRSLSFTFPSIKRNVIDACEGVGEVRIFSHFFEQTSISSARSNEYGDVDKNEHKLISHNWLRIEAPDGPDIQNTLRCLKRYGDTFRDNWATMRNLVHQLNSIEQCCHAALEWSPDIVVFVRPDLEYHNSFGQEIKNILLADGDIIGLPNWQHWNGGYNDRFAICKGTRAIRSYGLRGQMIDAYCQTKQSTLDPERLLRFSLDTSNIPLVFFGLRATRIRLGGIEKNESFLRYRLHNPWQKIIIGLGRAAQFLKMTH